MRGGIVGFSSSCSKLRVRAGVADSGRGRPTRNAVASRAAAGWQAMPLHSFGLEWRHPSRECAGRWSRAEQRCLRRGENRGGVALIAGAGLVAEQRGEGVRVLGWHTCWLRPRIGPRSCVGRPRRGNGLGGVGRFGDADRGGVRWFREVRC